MRLNEAYREIAERHINAARCTLDSTLQESSIFHAYHAFESIASAALASAGVSVPKGHAAKINQFIAKNRGRSFALSAATVAALLQGLRNRCLYPDLSPHPIPPHSLLTCNQAETVLKRVRGAVASIRRDLAI